MASVLTDGARAPEVTSSAPARDRRRSRWGDWLFLAFFVVYAGFGLAALTAGVVAAVAGANEGLHDQLHLWGFRDSAFGRAAEAMADAAHVTQPVWGLAVDFGFTLLNLGLGLFLLWLRPRDRTARLLAMGMVGTAVLFNLQAYGVYEALIPTTLDEAVHGGFHVIAAVAYVAALLLFPDGRLVPRWRARWLVALYAPAVAALVFTATRVEAANRTLIVILVFGVLAPAAGVAAQLYRYRRPATAEERQQSRLLFWALAPALLLSVYVVVTGVADTAFAELRGRGLTVIPVELFRIFQPVFAIIPIALFVGLVRFKLWDIDRVISRTLVYGALAAFVAAVYVGVVVGLGQLIGARGDNLILSIAATGAIAVAFEPVKERVQRLANRLVYGRRATPYEVLSGLAERMGEEVPTEEKLSRLAQLLVEGTTATRADVWLTVGGELRPAASCPDEAEPTLEPIPLEGEGLPRIGAVTAQVPVLHHGEVLGALTVTKPPAESLTPAEQKLLADIAGQAGLVLRNVRLTAELLQRLDELRASRQRLVAAQDEERRRLERDLHDGAQQQLVALRVQLGMVEQLAQKGKPVVEFIHRLGDATNEAIDTLRDLARGIYPPLLQAEGLPAALRSQGAKSPMDVEVVCDGVERYPLDVEAAVYFCSLEALQNAAKYSEADRVVVRLHGDDGWLRFEVSDDGRGFDPATCERGSGTLNMVDRMEALGGSLEIRSAPGRGTSVVGRVPVPA